MATNHSGQKSIKEPAKKHFTSNYSAQIVPDSAHMFSTAIYLQYNDSSPQCKAHSISL